MKKQRYMVMGADGVPCPRCALPTEIRQHAEITAKHLRQPYFFSRWFYCRNPDCPVTIHMQEEFKVWNGKNAAAQRIAADMQEQNRQMSFLRSL